MKRVIVGPEVIIRNAFGMGIHHHKYIHLDEPVERSVIQDFPAHLEGKGLRGLVR
jgi:hypothetical protein